MTTSTINRISFVSLGCPKNLVDSEAMLGELAQSGYDLVSEHDSADAIVINTCGFLDASRDESLEVIHEAIARKERGELKRVIVTGCLVQRHRAKMLEWAPGIDAMLGVFDRDRIRDAVSGPRRDEDPTTDAPPYWISGNALQAARERGRDTVDLTVQGKDGKGIGYWEGDGERFRLTPRHWTYLRMSEGCNQRCAFCTIPSIRGKMRSKPIDDLMDEARSLIASGVFELNLIGQDTTNYGRDIGWADPDAADPEGLIGLLSKLDGLAAEQGGGWIRLMYAYPTNFTDEMIDAIAALPNIVKYIDIPLQHVSDRMLDAMRRNVTGDQQRALMERLRERIPGVAIRTTFITGFPGETEEDHQELLEWVRDFQFDAMGVFKYSPEEGTVAGTMDKDPELHVPDEIKARREEELMLVQQELAFENAAYLAEQEAVFDVLVDGPGRDRETNDPQLSVYTGRCYHQAPQVDSCTWLLSSRELAAGELVRCTIVDSDGYDLIARPCEELETGISLPVIGT